MKLFTVAGLNAAKYVLIIYKYMILDIFLSSSQEITQLSFRLMTSLIYNYVRAKLGWFFIFKTSLTAEVF